MGRRDGGGTFAAAGRVRLVRLCVGLALIAGSVPRAAVASAGPPAVLFPASGAYLGSWVAPRSGESRADAVRRIESQLGRRLVIDHQYYKWDGVFPTGHEDWTVARGRLPFLNWKAQRGDGAAVAWARIASGAEDAVIAARADAIKDFREPLYLTFHHEPEDDLAAYGRPADYAAAFRRVVDVFRDRGVTNVAFVWTMMAWTFDPRSGRSPSAYYPGDGYVDAVGSDGYNWYPGRPDARWVSFRRVFRPTYEFATAHDKPVMAVEFGVQEDPAVPGHKGEWLRDVVSALRAWPRFKAIVYFDETTNGYRWVTDSSTSSMNGYRALANSPRLTAVPGTSPLLPDATP